MATAVSTLCSRRCRSTGGDRIRYPHDVPRARRRLVGETRRRVERLFSGYPAGRKVGKKNHVGEMGTPPACRAVPERASRRRASRNTARSIGRVSLPVKVFCWLG